MPADPLKPRRFLVNYRYTEVVNGEPREFAHETILEASSLSVAHARAISHFEELAEKSNVGWMRVLTKCEVRAAPRSATPEAGRRSEPDRTVDE